MFSNPSSDCFWAASKPPVVPVTQEAPLLAKPFLAHLTCSEIHAVTEFHWEVLGWVFREFTAIFTYIYCITWGSSASCIQSYIYIYLFFVETYMANSFITRKVEFCDASRRNSIELHLSMVVSMYFHFYPEI